MIEDADRKSHDSNSVNATAEFLMIIRCPKRIARPAMMWLMVAMFAMATSLVRICPCSTVNGESPCGYRALVTECSAAGQWNCCHGSQPSRPFDTVTERGCGFDLLVCHCTDHCPCQCQGDQRNDQATISSNRTIHRQLIERVMAVVAVLPRSAPTQSRFSRIGDSPIVHVATAQQRCATLSRFLI